MDNIILDFNEKIDHLIYIATVSEKNAGIYGSFSIHSLENPSNRQGLEIKKDLNGNISLEINQYNHNLNTSSFNLNKQNLFYSAFDKLLGEEISITIKQKQSNESFLISKSENGIEISFNGKDRHFIELKPDEEKTYPAMDQLITNLHKDIEKFQNTPRRARRVK